MTVDLSELVREVQRRGATLTVEGERLVLQGAGPRLPVDLRQALTDHKHELLKLLLGATESSLPESSPTTLRGAESIRDNSARARGKADLEQRRLLA